MTLLVFSVHASPLSRSLHSLVHSFGTHSNVRSFAMYFFLSFLSFILHSFILLFIRSKVRNINIVHIRINIISRASCVRVWIKIICDLIACTVQSGWASEWVNEWMGESGIANDKESACIWMMHVCVCTREWACEWAKCMDRARFVLVLAMHIYTHYMYNVSLSLSWFFSSLSVKYICSDL